MARHGAAEHLTRVGIECPVILLPRRVHLGGRTTEADAIHQAVQQDREGGPVCLRRSDEAHRMIAVQVVRTVHFQIVIVMRYVSGS
jgi:hypothetical protein